MLLLVAEIAADGEEAGEAADDDAKCEFVEDELGDMRIEILEKIKAGDENVEIWRDKIDAWRGDKQAGKGRDSFASGRTPVTLAHD